VSIGSSQQPASATGQVEQTIRRWEGEGLGQCGLKPVVPSPPARSETVMGHQR